MRVQNLSSGAGPVTAGRLKSRRASPLRRLLGPAIGAVVMLANPAVAAAHGPVAPVATSYLAKIAAAPMGLGAIIVDGYVRMWLRVPARDTLVVLDYRGAPYLRFNRAGVQVNRNSEMYYLNQTPSAWAVPSGLTRTTRPHWQPASAGHDYEWHDGRLQALASVAIAPGTSYVGRWTIPIDLDGRPTAIAGGLWHVGNPSIVWWWPLAVLFLCFWAAWRVRSPAVDRRLAAVLGVTALVALSVACLARELHGRPGVSIFQRVELVLVLAFAAWQLKRVLSARASWFSSLLIALVALWQGLDLVPTLVNGYVLVEFPAALVRVATVICLGCAVCLGLLALRQGDQAESGTRRRERRPDESDKPDFPREAHGVL